MIRMLRRLRVGGRGQEGLLDLVFTSRLEFIDFSVRVRECLPGRFLS